MHDIYNIYDIYDSVCLLFSFCWSVPPEFLRSFLYINRQIQHHKHLIQLLNEKIPCGTEYPRPRLPSFSQSDDHTFHHNWSLQTGDELSKRSKFVFCTWIGPNVSVMKKAKMGTDKAFVKEVIQVRMVQLPIMMMMMMPRMLLMMILMKNLTLQNISVELQPESLNEVSFYFHLLNSQ